MNHYFSWDMTQYLIVHSCVSCRQQRTAVTQPPGTARTSWKQRPWRCEQSSHAACEHTPRLHTARAACVYLSIPFCSKLKSQVPSLSWSETSSAPLPGAAGRGTLPSPSTLLSFYSKLHLHPEEEEQAPLFMLKDSHQGTLSPPPQPLLVAGEIRQTWPNPIRKSPGLKQNGSSKTGRCNRKKSKENLRSWYRYASLYFTKEIIYYHRLLPKRTF